MTDKKALSEALALALEHIRALHGTLAALMIDVAALRKVALKGPKAPVKYRQALASEAEKVRPMIAAAMKAYDDEIIHVKSLSQWSN